MKITPLHIKAMRMYLECVQKQKIAEEVRRTPKTISGWFGDEDFQEELLRETRRFLGEAIPSAIKALKDKLNSGFAFAQIAAAKDILDRAGLKPVQKVEQKSEHTGKDGGPIVSEQTVKADPVLMVLAREIFAKEDAKTGKDDE